MRIHVRTATANDAQLLTWLTVPIQQLHADARPDLFKPAAATPEMDAHFAALLAKPDVVIYVAEFGGQAAGCAVTVIVERPENPFTYAFRYLLVDQITVNPSQQRRGVGTALMAAVLALARAQGIRRVRLDAYAFNEDALTFYRRLGFRTYAHRLEMDLSQGQTPDMQG